VNKDKWQKNKLKKSNLEVKYVFDESKELIEDKILKVFERYLEKDFRNT